MKNDQMLLRGLACTLIGAAVLLAPYVLKSPAWINMIAGAHTVGWFSLVLGLALMGVSQVRKGKKHGGAAEASQATRTTGKPQKKK